MKDHQERAFLREMKGFVFYSTWIWPLHRRLARSLMTPRCQGCVISAKLKPLNRNQLCNDCQKEEKTVSQFQSSSKESESMKAELDHVLKSYQRKSNGPFDAVVLFSGGKDSCYLVDYLQKNYPKLRLVLLTIDNTFMSPFAKKNIDYAIQKLNCQMISLRPPTKTMEKMFRSAFLNLNDRGCSGTVDQLDGDLLHDIGRNFAQVHRIPLLISGCSRTQVEQILKLKHFESPPSIEHQPRTHVAHIPIEELCGGEDRFLWWQGKQPNSDFVPRVLFPFFALDLSESDILENVERLGLLPPTSKSPLLTNNRLIPLMAIVDMVKFGYSSFETEFSQMVRQGKADPIFWRNVFELSEYSAKTGRLISQSVDEVLARLGLSRKDLGLPQ